MVKVLLQELQANKEEAVRYLKQCGMSVWCDYEGVQRWISRPACEWHREEADPACSGCDPCNKKMKPGDLNAVSFDNERQGGGVREAEAVGPCTAGRLRQSPILIRRRGYGSENRKSRRS